MPSVNLYTKVDGYTSYKRVIYPYSFGLLKNMVSECLNIPSNFIRLETYSGYYYDETCLYRELDLYAVIDPIIHRLSNNISNIRDEYSNLNSRYNDLNDENYRLRNDLSSLRNNYSNLQSDYYSLSSKNSSNESKISTLTYQNEQNQNQINKLNQQIQKDKEEKEKKEQNFLKFKESFENCQKMIEEKKLEETKNFILKFISNKFLKEFVTEKNKESEFKKSLTSLMETFTKEFMHYCPKFLQSFKANSQEIIEQYSLKENNSIEHINFIVLGKAGVGKSSFINESLLLPDNKKAKEGRGKSVTDKSILYSSEKLKMIRMWDTQGLDYKITQEYILNEVKRIVEDGLKQGPDHYINIILYCTTGDRFQDEDGQLIYEIMKLYPSDNLPVIITQLKAYFKNKSKEMEKIIREILENYLEHQIVKKIEIRSIVSRDFIDENIYCKAEGIPELLRLSFDVMGRAISSATCKKLSQDIEELCKRFVDEKIDFIQKIFKYEMEIFDVSKSLFSEESEEEEIYFSTKKKEKKKIELSELNMYRKIQKEDYFINNFIKIMKNKLLLIFNDLNNENIQIDDDIDILKEDLKNEEENKEKENKEEEKKEDLKKEEDNQKEKDEEEKKEEENKEEENKEEEKKEENNQKEKDEEKKENNEEKPLILFFIEDRLKNMNKKIDEASDKSFEKLFKLKYQEYLAELQREQSIKNKEFNDNSQIIDVIEVEKNFREKLFVFYKNEFFKIFFCIILKLFMTNLKNILVSNYKKELKENEIIQKIINQKAEDSLKNITKRLKENLINELDNYIREKQENENNYKKPKNKEIINIDVDFNF